MTNEQPTLVLNNGEPNKCIGCEEVGMARHVCPYYRKAKNMTDFNSCNCCKVCTKGCEDSSGDG